MCVLIDVQKDVRDIPKFCESAYPHTRTRTHSHSLTELLDADFSSVLSNVVSGPIFFSGSR